MKKRYLYVQLMLASYLSMNETTDIRRCLSTSCSLKQLVGPTLCLLFTLSPAVSLWFTSAGGIGAPPTRMSDNAMMITH